MPPQDTHEDDKLTPEQREARERERAGRTAALEQDEAAEDSALDLLSQVAAAEGSGSEEAIAEEANKIAKDVAEYFSSYTQGGYKVDWEEVQKALDAMLSSARAAGRIEVPGGGLLDQDAGYSKEKLLRIVELVDKKCEVLKMRDALSQKAQHQARMNLYVGSENWDRVVDESMGFESVIIYLAEGGYYPDVSEGYEEDFPGITPADFGFMVAAYRKELIRMLVDAKGKSPDEYKKELQNRKKQQEQLSAAEGIVSAKFAEAVAMIEKNQNSSKIIYLVEKEDGSIVEEEKYLSTYGRTNDLKGIKDHLERFQGSSLNKLERYILDARNNSGRLSNDAIIRMAMLGYPKVSRPQP